VLVDLRDSRSSSHFQNLSGAVPSEPCLDESCLFTFKFKGHTVCDSTQQPIEARSVCETFISNVAENFYPGLWIRVIIEYFIQFSFSCVRGSNDTVDFRVDYLVR